MLLHFLCSGYEYKESKMEKRAYCELDAKIPGAGERHFFKNRPGAPGNLYGFAFASSNGVISLPAGFCFAFRGGFPAVRGTGRPAGSCYLRLGGVLPEVVTSIGGRPAGSRYLRLGGILPEVDTSVWGASCRKSLPPFGGRPAGNCYLRLGASCRKGFLCLERALPDRVISSSARCP